MDKDNENNQTGGRDQSHTQNGNYWNLFFLESAFQVITWVLIAFAIGGIWYYAGKNDMRGAFWSGVALVIFIILMLGLIADRHFFQGKNTTTEKERPHISIAAIGLSRYIFQPGMFKMNWEIRNSLGGPEISIVDANMTTFFECQGNSLPETPHYIQPERSKLNGVRIAPGDSFLVTYSYEGEPLSEATVKLIQDGTAKYYAYGYVRFRGTLSKTEHVKGFIAVYNPKNEARIGMWNYYPSSNYNYDR